MTFAQIVNRETHAHIQDAVAYPECATLRTLADRIDSATTMCDVVDLLEAAHWHGSLTAAVLADLMVSGESQP